MLAAPQVFNLAQYRPEKVLKQLWTNLREQEEAGDPRAGATRRNLRILVCGGDGTIAWIMKAVKLLDLQPHPPIAIMPLGTGEEASPGLRVMLRCMEVTVEHRESPCVLQMLASSASMKTAMAGWQCCMPCTLLAYLRKFAMAVQVAFATAPCSASTQYVIHNLGMQAMTFLALSTGASHLSGSGWRVIKGCTRRSTR